MRNAGLIAAAMMAMTGVSLGAATEPRRRERELTPEEKDAQMRNDLAECQAHKARLKSAAEKRARKAAKRVRDMTPNR